MPDNRISIPVSSPGLDSTTTRLTTLRGIGSSLVGVFGALTLGRSSADIFRTWLCG